MKKYMVSSIVNNVNDIVLDCFLFENIKQFLVKTISLFFLVLETTHNPYKIHNP